MTTVGESRSHIAPAGNVNSVAYTALAGRLLLAPIFVISGIGKIAGPDTYIGYIAAYHVPYPFLSLLFAIALETLGGAALMLGLRIRVVAMALALFSLITALVFHNDFSDQNQLLHFLKNLAIAGGLLQLAAFGAGALSLDARRERSQLG